MNVTEQLKAYAKGRKLPILVNLGKADQEWLNYINSVYNSLSITSDLALEQRSNQKIYGTEVENYQDLIKNYNQKYIDKTIKLPDCLSNIQGIFHLRFGILSPYSIIPMHIDEPYHLRFLCVIKGKHIYESQNKQTLMEEGDIYYINGCFKHSVKNLWSEERITLLGKFSINEHNIEYLNELLRT